MMIKRSKTQSHRRTFYCPACDADHEFRGEGEGAWQITGTDTAPTVTPSIRVKGYLQTRTGETHEVHCHLYVREGKLHYCKDSKHELAGEVVPMVPYSST